VEVLLDGVAAWKSLLTGDATTFIAILKAHIHFLYWIVFEQKKSIFPSSKKEVAVGVYKGSIVWDYFIKKLKTFSEIVGNK